MTANDSPRTVVLLGASNVTLGFPLLVESVRRTVGVPVDLLTAHGHGRSYGLWSRVLTRRLPPLTACGIWDALAGRPRGAQRPLAILTDIGNDLVYGVGPSQVVEWVETCLQRLKELDADIVLGGLPLCTVARLGPLRYHATRMCFFPGKGPAYADLQRRAVELDDGVRELSVRYGATLVVPSPKWYGFDPIHIHRRKRTLAWQTYLAGWGLSAPPTVAVPSLRESLRLWRLHPAERILAGRRQCALQPALSWGSGGLLSLY